MRAERKSAASQKGDRIVAPSCSQAELRASSARWISKVSLFSCLEVTGKVDEFLPEDCQGQHGHPLVTEQDVCRGDNFSVPRSLA